MKKYLKMFLIFLVLFQLILVLASIGSYSDTGSISLLCISLSISLINIVVVIVSIFKKEKDLYKLVETDDYFRDLNFKLIDPLSAGVVTKTSKIGFNSIMIIIYELIDKSIIVRKYHQNKFFISLKNSITLEEVNSLSVEEQTIIKTIFTGTDDKNEYEMNNIISNIKNDIRKSELLNSMLDELSNKIMIKYFSSYMYSIDETISTLVAFIVVLPIVTIVPFVFLSLENYMTIKFIVPLILYILNFVFYWIFISKKFPREMYFDEIKKLNGLYNFLNDFSNIKSHEIKYVELYDKYYLYALSFGLTDKVEDEYNFDSIDNSIKSNLKYLTYIEKGDGND